MLYALVRKHTTRILALSINIAESRDAPYRMVSLSLLDTLNIPLEYEPDLSSDARVSHPILTLF